eukprot:758396-Hanusia_phi.AAC.2
MVKDVATKEEFDSIIAGAKPVFVDFSATWCGPCQRIGPVFHKLADEFGDKCVCIKIDVDDNEETAAACGVESMPTFHVYKNGKLEHK